MNLSAGYIGNTDIKNWLVDTVEEGEGRASWESRVETCIISQWKFAVQHKELKPVLCDNLEEWGGAEGGREVQEEGDMCIPVPCWCMAETDTML